MSQENLCLRREVADGHLHCLTVACLVGRKRQGRWAGSRIGSMMRMIKNEREKESIDYHRQHGNNRECDKCHTQARRFARAAVCRKGGSTYAFSGSPAHILFLDTCRFSTVRKMARQQRI